MYCNVNTQIHLTFCLPLAGSSHRFTSRFLYAVSKFASLLVVLTRFISSFSVDYSFYLCVVVMLFSLSSDLTWFLCISGLCLATSSRHFLVSLTIQGHGPSDGLLSRFHSTFHSPVHTTGVRVRVLPHL